MNSKRATALILGLGAHGLALMRSLGRRGIYVEAVESDLNQFHRYSKYCKACYSVKSLDDESLIDFLVEYGKRSKCKKALFITKDKTVPVISEARELLREYYYFNLPDDECINMLMDKHLLSQFLDRNGCPAPKTVHITHREDIGLVNRITGFPCIIKPVLRAYGFKAAKATSERELLDIYNEASKYTNRHIVQEWIEGPDNEIYFCFVYVDSKGEFKATFTGRKIRKFPNHTGIACSTRGCCNDFVLKETMRLLKLADYRGFGSSEFKRDITTGSFKFVEFTVGRTDYNVETAIANKVDLPFIGYCDLIGAKKILHNTVQINDRIWIDFIRDIKAIRQENLRGKYGKIKMLEKMLKDFGPNTVFSFFAKDDLKPFLMYLFDRFLAVFRKIIFFYRPLRSSRKVRKGKIGFPFC